MGIGLGFDDAPTGATFFVDMHEGHSEQGMGQGNRFVGNVML